MELFFEETFLKEISEVIGEDLLNTLLSDAKRDGTKVCVIWPHEASHIAKALEKVAATGPRIELSVAEYLETLQDPEKRWLAIMSTKEQLARNKSFNTKASKFLEEFMNSILFQV